MQHHFSTVLRGGVENCISVSRQCRKRRLDSSVENVANCLENRLRTVKQRPLTLLALALALGDSASSASSTRAMVAGATVAAGLLLCAAAALLAALGLRIARLRSEEQLSDGLQATDELGIEVETDESEGLMQASHADDAAKRLPVGQLLLSKVALAGESGKLLALRVGRVRESPGAFTKKLHKPHFYPLLEETARWWQERAVDVDDEVAAPSSPPAEASKEPADGSKAIAAVASPPPRPAGAQGFADVIGRKVHAEVCGA